MKTYLYCLLATFSIALYSCSKHETISPKQSVEVTLNYTFSESGNMTRSSGSDVYKDFYDEYIETRQLTPTQYNLTFTNTETGAVAKINGHWDKPDAIRLVEGEYLVEGISHPISKYNHADSVFLAFNEKVQITKEDTNITLHAIYDSFLLLMDVNNTNNILLNTILTSNGSPKHELRCDDNVYWIFLRDIHSKFDGSSSSYYYNLVITRKDGMQSSISLKNMLFEKGKYYYFNDMSNGFDLPMMDSGN